MQSLFSTERLLLNLLKEDEHAFISELVNSKGWIEFIGDRNVHSEEDAINYIRKIRNTPDLHYWVVRLKDGNTPIGIISFLKRAYLDHFDIGFAFLPGYQGQGYAREAAGAVLDHVRQLPGYSTVLATTLPENIRSIQLLNKLGLYFEKEIQVEGDMLQVYSNQVTTLIKRSG